MARDKDKKEENSASRRPAGYPEPPDPARVGDLRRQMDRDKRARAADNRRISNKLINKTGRKARDIGTYTLIPMLMLAGPAVGYVLGLLVQNRWGGEPWSAVIGMLVGLVAGFRQVFLLLARVGDERGKKKGKKKGKESGKGGRQDQDQDQDELGS